MKLLCSLGFHSALPSRVWNDGHYFSACKRCHANLIRVPSGPWKLVPDGLRVVWREREPEDVIWPTNIV